MEYSSVIKRYRGKCLITKREGYARNNNIETETTESADTYEEKDDDINETAIPINIREALQGIHVLQSYMCYCWGILLFFLSVVCLCVSL